MNKIFQRHVQRGSTVFTDGWGGYRDLNTLGFDAFVVVHTRNYIQSYLNVVTGKVVIVTTNAIEGAWAHAKSHFRRIHGKYMYYVDGSFQAILNGSVICVSLL